jgi:copper(I)-binding protein
VKLPLRPLAVGLAVAGLGAAGLVRAAIAQPSVARAEASGAGPIVVTNACVRQPVPPSHTAAAYFTVYNTTDRADRLLSVETGAGAAAVLHTTRHNGSMTGAAGGTLVGAHSRLVLAPGRGHAMIQHVYGTLSPGQHVNLELDFQAAGPIDVVARVISFLAPVPGSR